MSAFEEAAKAMREASSMILKYRAALEFYANPDNHVRRDLYSTPNQDFPFATERSAVMKDGGAIARDVLKVTP